MSNTWDEVENYSAPVVTAPAPSPPGWATQQDTWGSISNYKETPTAPPGVNTGFMGKAEDYLKNYWKNVSSAYEGLPAPKNAYDALVGPVEAAASGITSIPGAIAGGLTSVATQNPKWGANVRNALTYQPSTPTGQAESRLLGAVASPASLPEQYLTEHGHPVLGQAATGALAASAVAPDVIRGYLGEGEEAPAATGPYTELNKSLSAADRQRLADIHQQAADMGITVRENWASPDQLAQDASNNISAAESIANRSQDFPEDSPMSRQLQIDYRKQLGQVGAYGKIRDLPSIQLTEPTTDLLTSLPEDVQGRLRIIDTPKKPGIINDDATISGKAAIDLWTNLKDRAVDKWDAYDANSDTNFRDQANDLTERARAVHSDIVNHLVNNGMSDIAQQFDQDTKLFAKSYTIQGALKNGHLDVNKLAKQYAGGAPMDPEFAMLAELGDRYPQAFKLSNVVIPKPGLMRRGVAAMIPKLTTGAGAAMGAGAGSLVGMPTVGAGLGAAGGSVLGQNLAGRVLGK